MSRKHACPPTGRHQADITDTRALSALQSVCRYAAGLTP